MPQKDLPGSGDKPLIGKSLMGIFSQVINKSH
jgi:hypothetical protein